MDYKKLAGKLRNNNVENNCHDCALGYYAFEAATAITDLLARAEAAEASCKRLDEARERANEACAKWEYRAEKAERERDAAVSDMEALMWHSGDGCNICANAIEVHREPYVRLDCALKGHECNPKWRGQKEE